MEEKENKERQIAACSDSNCCALALIDTYESREGESWIGGVEWRRQMYL